MGIQPVFSVELICSNTREWLTSWTGIQPILSVDLIYLNTWEQLTLWMGVQPFLSVDLICLNTREQLTCWTYVQPFLSVVLICSNTGEQLTCWTYVQPFSLWFAQTLENNSHPRHMFSLSHSDLLKHWRATHMLDAFPIHLVSKINKKNLQTYWSVL